jgi:hypothetical protein
MVERANIIALESRRCDHERARDWQALGVLLDESFVYVAGSGAVINKKDLLDGRKQLEWLQLERQGLEVRAEEALAVLTGYLIFKTREGGSEAIAEGKAFCTQVLVRKDGNWLFTLQQLTRLKVTA